MSGADKFSRDVFGNNAEYYFNHEFPKTADKNNAVDDSDEVFEDNSPTIDSAIKEKDFDKLVKYVLDGKTTKLLERSSEDEEVQEFIDNVPALEVNKSLIIFQHNH